jgi:hypothetical protein
MTTKTRKQSYTIPCSSVFRDMVSKLAERRSVNVADLARSVLLVVPEDVIRSFPDPGGPPPGDREETVLKSGPSAGRPWRRKPRLQARLSPGYDVSVVRRALNLALILDDGQHTVRIQNSQDDAEQETKATAAKKENRASQEKWQEMRQEMERLQAIVSVLLFAPLSGGVMGRADALHVLGFAPSEMPDKSTVRARFRMLATIHHPDSNYGNHQRMSQLNAAMDLLNA